MHQCACGCGRDTAAKRYHPACVAHRDRERTRRYTAGEAARRRARRDAARLAAEAVQVWREMNNHMNGARKSE